MKFGRLGIMGVTAPMNGAQLVQLATRVEALGYSTLWYPEGMGFESLSLGGYLLGHSKRLVVASGIANIYARDAAAAAMGHNTLNELYGGRFVLGLGVSHAPLVSGLRGHEYKAPLATMRAYLDGMEAYWQSTQTMPSSKQVVLAALGPKMTALAGQRTLGAFPYNVTPRQAAISRQIMGPKAALICEQKVCITTDPVAARRAARAALGFYLAMPNYTQNWFRLGFDASDLEHGGSDRLMDAMVIWGNVNTVGTKLRAYFEQGADQLVIHSIRSDGEAGPDWAALEALASLN